MSKFYLQNSKLVQLFSFFLSNTSLTFPPVHPLARHLIHIKWRIFFCAFPFFGIHLRNGFLCSDSTQTHTHEQPGRLTHVKRSPRPHIALKALRFFLFHPHFHLKTIQTRWKMTRELRCNKWKFQIVVPFLWSAQRAHFWCFFSSSRDCISGISTHCLCYYFNSLFLLSSENSFFKTTKKGFSFSYGFFSPKLTSKRSWRLFNCWKVEHVAV